MLARIGAEGVACSGDARREQQEARHDSGAEGNSCHGILELARQPDNVR